jgi:hypothetical protein
MTSAVQPAGPSAPINPAENGDSASEVVTPSSSLLPEPGAGGLTGTQDALSMMYSLVAKQGQLAMAIGENNVESASRDQQAMLAIETQAEQAQQQAEASQSGGFWHDLLSVAEDVAKVAGIVVAAAAAAVATVFTAGAAGIAVVAIAAILISSGALVSATHCLGKDSAYIGMGMEITGSIMTMGAASGAVASTALTEAVQTVSTVAQLTQGTATILAGVATIRGGQVSGRERGRCRRRPRSRRRDEPTKPAGERPHRGPEELSGIEQERRSSSSQGPRKPMGRRSPPRRLKGKA